MGGYSEKIYYVVSATTRMAEFWYRDMLVRPEIQDKIIRVSNSKREIYLNNGLIFRFLSDNCYQKRSYPDSECCKGIAERLTDGEFYEKLKKGEFK